MLKWLTKFTLEIAPPIAATVIGAFVVHQLWPSDKPDVQPAATPPAAQVSTDTPKPASPPRVISTKKADQPAASEEASVTATTPPTGTGKTARQSSDVAKTNPPPRENVFERAEKALAAIPPAKSSSSAQPSEVRAPARTTAVVPLPPVPPQQPPSSDIAAVTPVTPEPATATAVVTPVAPPPMDPPREITSTVSVAPPPPPQVAPRDRNPLRVYHSDRANLADIPMADGDEVPPPPQTAAAPPAEQAPQGPPREKNIVENILGSLHSVLPERLR